MADAMTNLWKAGIAAGGAAAGILAVQAATQLDEARTAAALGAGALVVAGLTIVLVLRPGAGVERGDDLRVTAFTIFLLTLAVGLLVGAGGTDHGGGHG